MFTHKKNIIFFLWFNTSSYKIFPCFVFFSLEMNHISWISFFFSPKLWWKILLHILFLFFKSISIFKEEFVKKEKVIWWEKRKFGHVQHETGWFFLPFFSSTKLIFQMSILKCKVRFYSLTPPSILVKVKICSLFVFFCGYLFKRKKVKISHIEIYFQWQKKKGQTLYGIRKKSLHTFGSSLRWNHI